MKPMAGEVRKLDITVGDMVEVGRRRYDVVSDKLGALTLEPQISKTVKELRAERCARPLSRKQFGALLREGEA
jgi:hypothetical protein